MILRCLEQFTIIYEYVMVLHSWVMVTQKAGTKPTFSAKTPGQRKGCDRPYRTDGLCPEHAWSRQESFLFFHRKEHPRKKHLRLKGRLLDDRKNVGLDYLLRNQHNSVKGSSAQIAHTFFLDSKIRIQKRSSFWSKKRVTSQATLTGLYMSFLTSKKVWVLFQVLKWFRDLHTSRKN